MKILAPDSAVSVVGSPQRLRIIVGHFDPVFAEHARTLSRLRDGACNVAIVTDGPQPISPQRARAEVLAGLAAIDYVIPAGTADVGQILAGFPSAEVVRDEEQDAERTRTLMDHVRARQAAK